MKKILIILLTITIASIFTACADKTPFKEQTPLSNSALVYVYAKQVILDEDGSSVARFQLLVDDKSIGIRLVENEYTPLDLKAQNVKISSVKDALITKEITLDLKDGDIYYLRAQMLNGDNFKFEIVERYIALEEIAKTKLYGSFMKDSIDSLINVDKKTKAEKSKIEQIKDANQLKIDGIITQEEFEKLKVDILNAN